jgi:hypothetical protein
MITLTEQNMNSRHLSLNLKESEIMSNGVLIKIVKKKYSQKVVCSFINVLKNGECHE